MLKLLQAYLRAWRATQLEEKPRDLHACNLDQFGFSGFLYRRVAKSPWFLATTQVLAGACIPIADSTHV